MLSDYSGQGSHRSLLTSPLY